MRRPRTERKGNWFRVNGGECVELVVDLIDGEVRVITAYQAKSARSGATFQVCLGRNEVMALREHLTDLLEQQP